MSSIALSRHLAGLASRQHGTVSAAQLLGELTRAQIAYRVHAGILTPFLGDTFMVAGAPITSLARSRAATLAIDGSVIAVRAAGYLHAFPRCREVRPEVIAAPGRSHPTPGITVRRRDDLLDRHRCTVQGIPCTTVPRTVLDLAAYISRKELGDLVDDLAGLGRLSLPRLFDEFDHIARRGRNGTRNLRLVLEPRLHDQLIPASVLHRRGLEFLRRHGFPTPVVEFKPPWAGPAVGRVDVAYPDHKAIVEFDGRAWHDRSDRFEDDRLRDQLAMADGWIVLRVTWSQLDGDQSALAHRLRSALSTRSLCSA